MIPVKAMRKLSIGYTSPVDLKYANGEKNNSKKKNEEASKNGSGDYKETPKNQAFTIPDSIINEVACRFLLNLPNDQQFNSIRLFFQIELAHWFFIDHYCGEDSPPHLAALASIPFEDFAQMMFVKTPYLRRRGNEFDSFYAKFKCYKRNVPSCGAILLDESMEYVVLVQGFRNAWGFPKGKKNENEEHGVCAVREVFEETGFDILPYLNRNHYIDCRVSENRVDRLYIIVGVDRQFEFKPQTNFEIKQIAWFRLDEISDGKVNKTPTSAIFAAAATSESPGIPSANLLRRRFYSVFPYIKRLDLWTADKKEKRNVIDNFKAGNEALGTPQTPGALPSPRLRFSNDQAKRNASVTPGEHLLLQTSYVYSYDGKSIKSNSNEATPKSKMMKKPSKVDIDVSFPPIAGLKSGKNPKRKLFIGEGDEDTKASGFPSAESVSSQLDIFKKLCTPPSHQPPEKLNSSSSQKNGLKNRDVLSRKNAKYKRLNTLLVPSWQNFEFDYAKIRNALDINKA